MVWKIKHFACAQTIMSGLKGDCKSFSAVSDAPTAENSGNVPTDAGVREVSCVRRGETSFVPLLWCFGSWFRFMVLNVTGRLTTFDPIYTIKTTCAYVNCIITCYSLPTCFNRCHGHHQGCIQHYKESKQIVKMHKWTTHCYTHVSNLLHSHRISVY